MKAVEKSMTSILRVIRDFPTCGRSLMERRKRMRRLEEENKKGAREDLKRISKKSMKSSSLVGRAELKEVTRVSTFLAVSVKKDRNMATVKKSNSKQKMFMLM
jgi:hypothetical protein